jgi:uncharacterized RDD family membrane protein YckC
MAMADPGRPSRDTGLPPGVEVGPLGKRVAAYLIEALVPAIVSTVLVVVLPDASGTVRGVLSILGALVVVGWSLLIWYLLAERAAGPGLRLMHLQLVGFYDGRPIGWVRVLLRAVIFWLLSATGIGLILLLVFLVLHPRKQGWHDLAVNAVVIKERVLPPSAPRAGVAQHVGTAPEQSRERAFTPPPMYGPVTSYSPVPGGPTGPVAQPQGVPTGVPTPQGPPPQGPPPQPLTPPPGLGYPRQADQPYVPVAAEPPGPSRAGSTAIPQGEEPWTGETRSMAAPPVAEPPAETLDWHAVLDDGRRVVVDHLVLLGRNPQPAPGEEDAQLIKIADETRTVSKLHLAMGVDQSGLYVVDRGSTNGSTVTTPGGATRRCVPGETVYVNPGSIVSMGDHWLEVRRGEVR